MVPFGLRILFLIYAIGVLCFQIFCHLWHLNDRFWTEDVEDFTHFDFIVVGGGSAGCVIAARLAQDKGHSVLLLEAGGRPSTLFNTPSITPLLQGTDFDWQFKTQPQQNSSLALDDKTSLWPRGKVLGGSGRLNFMMYVRGDPSDFDSWAKLGNPGWSFKEVLPFFKKSEKYATAADKYRGHKGEMSVEYLKWTSELSDIFLEGGKDMGYKITDLNGPINAGFTVTQVTALKGQRHSSDSAFLSGAGPNLKILTHAHVTKVLLLNKKAYGVEFDLKGQRKYAYASKEIILSAGAIGSPQLLMLSGIGPADHLRQHDIEVRMNLPGVGSNLQDHITSGANNVLLEGKAANLAVTLAQLLSPWTIWQYIWSNSGPLSSNGCEAHALIYSSEEMDREREPPDLQLLFFPTGHSLEGGSVIRKISGITQQMWDSYFAPFYEKHFASIFAVLLRPKSVGEIRLKTNNPHDDPIIDPNYLSHQDDLEVMIRGMKKVAELTKTESFRLNGASLNTFPLPGCEDYVFGSDSYWSCYVQQLSGTVYHPCCTCKMAPDSDPEAVVDSQLRVRGVQGLRVADASIMPTLIGANINAATVMIGEKVAHMVRQFWVHKAQTCDWAHFFSTFTLCDDLKTVLTSLVGPFH